MTEFPRKTDAGCPLEWLDVVSSPPALQSLRTFPGDIQAYRTHASACEPSAIPRQSIISMRHSVTTEGGRDQPLPSRQVRPKQVLLVAIAAQVLDGPAHADEPGRT